MILYHVSTDLEKDGLFYPRRPNLTMENELYDMNRICVAPSIADCLTAIPNGGSRLDELNLEQAGIYKVFRIDTEKLAIPESAILGWKELFENGWVPDAEWSEEHWILESFTVPDEDSFFIHLTEWEEESCDLISHRMYQLAEAEYDGDYLLAHQDTTGELVPCMSAIEDIKYQECYSEGDEFFLFAEDDDLPERVVALAKTVYGIELELEGFDFIRVISGELTAERLAVCAFGKLEQLQGILQENGMTDMGMLDMVS